MDMGTGLTRPPTVRVRVLVVAIAWVIVGALGACLSGLILVPDVRAARGGGVTGIFMLTEPNGCDRYPPPKQRCGWFGNFRSDDGKIVLKDVELAGGLPPGAQVGDTVPARDVGYSNAVYQVNDHQTWQLSAVIFAAFCTAFLVGIVLLRPWTWRSWLKR